MKLDRRTLLIGGGAGIGLVVVLAAWPRHVGSGLRTSDKEAVLGPFIKVAENGRVTVAVPQAETGQGTWTGLAQIVADELGAKWETMAVEPAPSSPLYANPLIDVAGLRPWTVRETRARLRVTAGSTSIRAYEQPLRQAAAAARGLLIAAAAKRWDVAAAECDTADGAVVHEGKRLSFGALAADAADRAPAPVAVRAAGSGKLAGQELARLDLPPKSDGSMRFAADVRLPGMLFASLRMAPPGGTLREFSETAARRVAGVRDVIVGDSWLAAIGETWWAAEKALVVADPRFSGPDGIDIVAVTKAMNDAIERGGADTIYARGGADVAAAQAKTLTAEYRIAPGQHIGLEPQCATVRFAGDRLEVWAPAQAPEFARAAAAAAGKVSIGSVTFYPTAVGSASGRALEADAVPIAVALAAKTGKPVQLTVPHVVAANHDRLRPPLLARLSAVPSAASGTITAWSAKVATAPGLEGALARLAGVREPAADITGSVPPYGIPSIRVERVTAMLPISTGYMRGGHEGMAGFVTESFIDEVARAIGAEPLAFRIAMLGGNVRLAKAIMTAAAIGQWDGGGSGSTMGLACASAFGSHIGLLAQARIGDGQHIVVDRLVAAVDCGHAINPSLVRQQVEGGLLAALALAIAPAPVFVAGMPRARPLKLLGLERLAGTPKIEVELIPSSGAPGGVSGLAFTVLAGAVGNALAAAGRRLRSLPFDSTAA
ncbi:MAG: xanthine dehydrogenase family protein molybdopterin-binding subunit [Sphingomicrobium sp.]